MSSTNGKKFWPTRLTLKGCCPNDGARRLGRAASHEWQAGPDLAGTLFKQSLGYFLNVGLANVAAPVDKRAPRWSAPVSGAAPTPNRGSLAVSKARYKPARATIRGRPGSQARASGLTLFASLPTRDAV
jgi:hypothetical protein